MREWARDVRRLLWTCNALAQWHGNDLESDAFATAAKPVEASIKQVVTLVSGASTLVEQQVESPCKAVFFECSEALARVLSPILHLVVTPVPSFVQLAPEELPAELANKLRMAFGFFSVTATYHLCRALWQRFPSLAPEGYTV